MTERMHSFFSMNPERSLALQAPSRSPSLMGGTEIDYLPAILRALAVDPDEAADVAEQGVLVPYGFDDFVRSGRLTEALVTVSEFVRWRKDTRSALRELSTWCPMLGVWCACDTADEGLSANVMDRKLDSGAYGAKKAIAACRDYARGAIPAERAIRACEVASRMAESRMLESLRAVRSLGEAIRTYEVKKDLYWFALKIGNVWANAHNAIVGNLREATREDREEATRRLTGIVANACLTFPVRSASGRLGASIAMPVALGVVAGAGAMFLAKRV